MDENYFVHMCMMVVLRIFRLFEYINGSLPMMYYSLVWVVISLFFA